MAGTLTRILLGPSGSIWMIVIPDDDKQLTDPAFSPPGLTPVDVPNAGYKAAQKQRDIFSLVQPILAQQNPPVATQVGLKIQALDHADVATVTANAQVVPQGVIDAQTVLVTQRMRFLAAFALDNTIDFPTWAANQDAINAPTVQAAQSVISQQAATTAQAISAAQSAYDAQFAINQVNAYANLQAQLASGTAVVNNAVVGP